MRLATLRPSQNPGYFDAQILGILSPTLASWPHLSACQLPKEIDGNSFEHFIKHVTGVRENSNLKT